MEPTLAVGSTVRVERLKAPPQHGDIVLIKGESRWIVHRVIHADRRSNLVFHGGDLGGGIGTCSEDAVLGLVTAVLDPETTTTTAVESLDIAIRRWLALARWRCRLFAACRSITLTARIEKLPLAQPIGRTLRRILL